MFMSVLYLQSIKAVQLSGARGWHASLWIKAQWYPICTQIQIHVIYDPDCIRHISCREVYTAIVFIQSKKKALEDLHCFRYVFIFYFYPSGDWPLWDVQPSSCTSESGEESGASARLVYLNSPVHAGQPHVGRFLGAAAHGYVLTD